MSLPRQVTQRLRRRAVGANPKNVRSLGFQQRGDLVETRRDLLVVQRKFRLRSSLVTLSQTVVPHITFYPEFLECGVNR